MKNIIVVIIALLTVSCQTKLDMFEEINTDPIILFQDTNQIIYDSLKLSTGIIEYEFTVLDERENLDLKIIKDSSIIVFVDGTAINDIISLKSGKHILKITANTLGIKDIELIIIDEYARQAIKKISITVFKNLKPVAILAVEAIKQNSVYEYEIKGVDSYDSDEKYGGYIKTYEFQIGDYYSFSNEKFGSIKHIFPGPGTYVISLRVYDSDNEASNYVFTEVVI